MQQQHHQQQQQLHNNNPPTAVQHALAAGAHSNANRRIADVDSSYVREWRKFQNWVTEKRATGVLPPGSKFLT